MSELESSISSWATATLGELSKVTSGVGFPKKYQGQSSGDYPVYKVGDVSRAVTQGQGKLSAANHYVTTDEATVLKGAIFRAGSTLFAKIGEAVKLNRRAFVISPGLADNNVMAVIPFLHESDRYLHYFLRTVDLSEVSRSTTVPSVRKGDIEELRIPLPPLAEQKIIADKLDTLLAQVDNIKTRLERIPEILKRFRQSVLAAALSGRLTEEWRNGARFTVEKRELNSFVSINIGHAFKSKEFTDQGIPLLRGQNIEPGALRWSETKHFPESLLSDFQHLFIEAGDIVLAMDRPIISSGLKIARAKPSDLPCVLVQRVARFKNFDGLLPDYLYILLQDVSFNSYIQPNQTGSDIPHISGKQILAYPVDIPDVEEQTEIVRRVDQLFAHADRIEQQVNQALARVNNLTQSILAKAFRGELTEQWRKDNPELISGENSASALLERIKAERAAKTPKKATRKKAFS